MNSIDIHKSFVTGDLENLMKALGYPNSFPNDIDDEAFGNILEYAIYHSPLSFVDKLLSLGADPNYFDGSYPSILAALSTDRPDKFKIIRLLLQHGADINMRGINDYTPLHNHWSSETRDFSHERRTPLHPFRSISIVLCLFNNISSLKLALL